MIYANEATNLTEASIQRRKKAALAKVPRVLRKIERKIKKAIAKGDNRIVYSIPVPSNVDYMLLTSAVVKELEEHGYMVEEAFYTRSNAFSYIISWDAATNS